MVTLDGTSTARGARRLLQAPSQQPRRHRSLGERWRAGSAQRVRAPALRGRLSHGVSQAFLVCTKEHAMLLGIDYGTTRTVVAVVDRGNYPVVSFQTAEGDTQDW